MADMCAVSRIMMVDDHSLVRLGMRRLLEAEPDLEVCAEAEALDEARTLLRTLRPDLILLDRRLNDGDGLQLLPDVQRLPEPVPVLVVSAFADRGSVDRSYRAGASGHLDKQYAAERLVETVRSLLGARRGT